MKQRIRIPVYVRKRGEWYVPSYWWNDREIMRPNDAGDRLVFVVAEIEVPDVDEVVGTQEPA